MNGYKISFGISIVLLFFALNSFTNTQNDSTNEFQTNIDDFITKYLTDFTIVSQTYHANSEGNDVVLGERTDPIWHKSLTLKSKKSFKNTYNQTVYLRLFLNFYQYDSNKQCVSALDSLLNCFGNDCTKIKWNIEQNLKTTPLIYLINEKTIIVCKIHCEHENDFWAIFKKDIIKTFGKARCKIIQADCGGPVYFDEF